VYPINVQTFGEERFLARLAKPFVFQTEAVRGVASTGDQIAAGIELQELGCVTSS